VRACVRMGVLLNVFIGGSSTPCSNNRSFFMFDHCVNPYPQVRWVFIWFERTCL